MTFVRAGVPTFLSMKSGNVDPIGDLCVLTGSGPPPAGFVKVPYNIQLGTSSKIYIGVKWWASGDSTLPVAAACLIRPEGTAEAVGACLVCRARPRIHQCFLHS